METKNLFVSYEIAKALKEKGFNESCLGEWQTLKTGNNLVIDEEEDRIYDVPVLEAEIKAPLYQQVIDWLLNERDIAIGWIRIPYPDSDGLQFRYIFNGVINSSKYGKSYTALNKAIEEALKLI